MSVSRNIVANFAGGAWLALMSLAFVPFYIHLMGIEAYGLVGVLVSLQAMFAVLDLGLSQTLAREMARLSADRVYAKRRADTVRTLEIVYWGMAVVVTLTVALLSHSLAYHWLNPERSSRESLREALWIIAFVLGLRWPMGLYIGGLNGLQRQVLVNVLLAGFATLQGLGALAVLWFIAPTVHAFFWWHAVIALFQVSALRLALRQSLLPVKNGAFNTEVLQQVWQFAAGMTGIALLVTLLTQLDKIVLSRLLTLPEFGYYVFATTVAAALFRLIHPVFTAYSPRLIELASRENPAELTRVYHQSCQVMALVLFPPALVLAAFSAEILSLWTHDPELVSRTHLLVSLLAIGNALNGIVNMPYALQLAYGWTRLAFYLNVASVAVLVPALYLATLQWGAVGAAGVWVVLNAGYVIVGIRAMHRRLLKNEIWQWYVKDVGKPLIAVVLVVTAGRLITGSDWSAAAKLAMLFMMLALSALAAALNVNALWSDLKAQLIALRR